MVLTILRYDKDVSDFSFLDCDAIQTLSQQSCVTLQIHPEVGHGSLDLFRGRRGMILKVSRYPGRLQRPFAIQQDGGFRALVYREAIRMPFHGCHNRSIFFSNLDWAHPV